MVFAIKLQQPFFGGAVGDDGGGAGVCAHVRACARRQAGLAASCDKSYPERLFILVLPLELKQECWSPLKPNT